MLDKQSLTLSNAYQLDAQKIIITLQILPFINVSCFAILMNYNFAKDTSYFYKLCSHADPFIN